MIWESKMRLGIVVVLLTLSVPGQARAQARTTERGPDQGSGQPFFAPFGLDLPSCEKLP